jgi:hypothetical protein
MMNLNRFTFVFWLANSDPRAQVEVVPINADLSLGEVKVTQTAFPPMPAKTYALPADKTEGPSFSDKDFIPGTSSSHTCVCACVRVSVRVRVWVHLTKALLDRRDTAHLAPSGIIENPVPENTAKGDLGIDVKQKDAIQPDQVRIVPLRETIDCPFSLDPGLTRVAQRPTTTELGQQRSVFQLLLQSLGHLQPAGEGRRDRQGQVRVREGRRMGRDEHQVRGPC